MEEIATLVNANCFILLLLPFLSGMLYDFFQPGMVFSKYGDFVFKEEREDKEPKWWKKPIGGCLKCMHVWVCILFILWTGDIDAKYVPFISLSYYILTLCYYR